MADFSVVSINYLDNLVVFACSVLREGYWLGEYSGYHTEMESIRQTVLSPTAIMAAGDKIHETVNGFFRASCKMVFSPKLGVMLKILSSEY